MTYNQLSYLQTSNTITYEYDDSNSLFSNDFFKNEYSPSENNLNNCSFSNLEFIHQQQKPNNDESDSFWGQSNIEDVLVNFSPSDIKLELLTDDVLPISSQYFDSSLSNTSYSNNLIDHNSDLINNINLDISLSNNNISNDEIYYQQNYEQNNNVYFTHNIDSQFEQKNQQNSLIDNNQMHVNQPSTSNININCQHQNQSNQQNMDLETYENNDNTEFINIKQEEISDFELDSSPTNTIEFEMYELENYENFDKHEKMIYHHPQQENYDYENQNFHQNVIFDCLGNEENGFFNIDDEYFNEENKENINNVKFKINRQKKGKKKERKKNDEPQIAGGYIKPPYSYSCLITLALKNSPNGELTVAKIYAFLREHFPYFCAAPIGWRNSVRHNLSLSNSFHKIEVEATGCNSRKSCLWRLNTLKLAKMNQELKKWRERSLPIILESMRNPELFKAVENGTMGLPESVMRCQISNNLPSVNIDNNSSDSSKIDSNSQNKQSEITQKDNNNDSNVLNQPSLDQIQSPLNKIQSSPNQIKISSSQITLSPNQIPSSSNQTNNHSTTINSSLFNSPNNNSKNSGESIHNVAVRKLDYLLQQKSATILNPNKDLVVTDRNSLPPPSKRAFLNTKNDNTIIQSTSFEFIKSENYIDNTTKKRSSLSNKSINKTDNSVVVNKRLFHSNSPPNVMRNKNNFLSKNQLNNQNNKFCSNIQLSSSSTNFKIMKKPSTSFQSQTLTDDFENVYISDGFKNSIILKDVTNSSQKNIFELQKQNFLELEKQNFFESNEQNFFELQEQNIFESQEENIFSQEEDSFDSHKLNFFEFQEQLDFDWDRMNDSFSNQINDERSMSPILYSSSYDTVKDAINNNCLLFPNCNNSKSFYKRQ